jgi:two-component system response regulator HydG
MLWNASRNGKFREDLFHRFNEFSIQVPPLRERKEDIMIFARHFLHVANAELNKGIRGFSPEVEAIFKDYVWYGNLRELKNVVKRATLLSDEELIDVKSIPFELVHYSKLQFEPSSGGQLTSPISLPSSSSGDALTPSLPSIPKPEMREPSLKSAGIDAEYEVILNALKKVNFNKSKAAKLLQIDRKTLYNKIKQYRELKGLTSELEL